MGKIDKEKELIGAMKVYLALIIAMLIADVGATVRLYSADELALIFWLGISSIMILSLLFVFIAKSMHKRINQLEDL